MNIQLIALLLFLVFEIFLVFKCLNLSNQLISYVSNRYPELYEKFDQPAPGFIRPNPFKANKLEKYLLNRGPIEYQDNEKLISLAKRLKRFNNFHYLVWFLLFLAFIIYLAE